MHAKARITSTNDIYRPDRMDAKWQIWFYYWIQHSMISFQENLNMLLYPVMKMKKPDVIFIEGQSALRNQTVPADRNY